MPFDGAIYDPLVSGDLAKVIALLERGLARVTEGYCWDAFYRPKTWYRRHPQFCMCGALYRDDNGDWEPRWPFVNHELAEQFLRQVIKHRSLVNYGTAMFARRRVIRAYKKALAAANADATQRLEAHAK